MNLNQSSAQWRHEKNNISKTTKTTTTTTDVKVKKKSASEWPISENGGQYTINNKCPTSTHKSVSSWVAFEKRENLRAFWFYEIEQQQQKERKKK